jgi:hypothetical protein
LFDTAASLISAHVHDNPETSFNDLEHEYATDCASVATTCMSDSIEEILPRRVVNSSSSSKSVGLVYLDNRPADDIAVPDAFGPNAFDDAEESIKYIVLTNTWPKFVAAGYASNLKQRSHLGKLKEMLADRWSNIRTVRHG